YFLFFVFFFQAEDGIRDLTVTGVQTCALPISDGIERSDHGEGLSWASAGRSNRRASEQADAVLRRTYQHRHCEERSDEAIQSRIPSPGLLRFARNDDSTKSKFRGYLMKLAS